MSPYFVARANVQNYMKCPTAANAKIVELIFCIDMFLPFVLLSHASDIRHAMNTIVFVALCQQMGISF